MGRLERDFQPTLKAELKQLFPGCLILKNDPQLLQGVPDLVILFGNRWALLEVKRSADAPARPNQPYYVAKAQEDSFGAFVYPENKREVLEALHAFFYN